MAMLTHTMSLSKGGTGFEKGLRDPSFSTYLNGAEQSFVLNLVKQCKVDEDDGEIGVFSADKYFNEGLDEKARVCEKPVTPMVLSYADKPIKSIQSGSESRAISVLSGSSANSQSTLLQRACMNQSVYKDSKMQGRGGYLGSFRCKCVCSDKNSVAVEEYKSCGDNLTISQRAAKEPMQKGICPRKTSLISPRKSIDVFGLQGLERRDKTFSFETEKNRRLNWENELHKTVETVIPMKNHGVVYAESDSDVSSDLFELEDFSTPNVNPFQSRQVSRNMSGSATPIACYAPTEASIAWSVVTASAADFSITSDYQELHSGANTANSKTGSTTTNATVDKPKRLSSSFLACNSQDSVTVVHQTHKTYEKISHQKITKARI